MSDIRAGATVLHRPSGERWVVAYAEPERDALGWCGWPEGIAKLSDCKLVTACTDEQHESALRQWASKTGGDHRIRRCAEQLAELERNRKAVK